MAFVRIYGSNAYDWTHTLAAIAATIHRWRRRNTCVVGPRGGAVAERSALAQQASGDYRTGIPASTPFYILVMGSAGHLRTNREEMQAEVDRFRRNMVVYTRCSEVPKSTHIPESWLDLLAQQESHGNPRTPAEWAEFSDVLPQVTAFLRKNVCAVGILMEQPDTPSLVYAYRHEGEINLFRGWPPSFAANGPVPRVAAIWSKLPPRFQRLYERVHNGWVFLPSWTMGPARADHIRFLSDDEWDLRPGEETGLPFQLEDVISIFANGAGDSLCIDTAACQLEKAGLVWWHEEPGKPDAGQDVWAVMDEWFAMFVEGAE